MGPGSETTAASGANSDIVAFIVAGAFWVALFCWLTVVGWARNRRMEREAYYRHETERRLLERGDAGANEILRLRRAEARARWLRRREGLRLTGVITAVLGAGILVGLQFVDTGDPLLSGAGGIPLIIGSALLLYAYVLYPKLEELDVDTLQQPSHGRSIEQQD